MKKIALTGDRPTGPLHLGHYVGSLVNRVKLQEEYKQYIMIADVQALTDNVNNPKKVRKNILEVALDYFAVGIDPKKSIVFIQSLIPQLFELTIYYLNLVTVNRLKRNPTVKSEIKQKNMEGGLTAGFLMYPVSQAADITAFKTNIVPVGEDQLPMIEQTNEIVRSFNNIYKDKILVEAKPLLSSITRLPGLNGRAKMSKSLGNAIFLSDETDVLVDKVMSMYTDPEHIRVSDPGRIEGNTVFAYLDIFAPDKNEIERMKEHYKRGGLGDVKVKKFLIDVLEEFLSPIRDRRKLLAQDPKAIINILLKGSELAEEQAAKTLKEVREAMSLDYK